MFSECVYCSVKCTNTYIYITYTCVLHGSRDIVNIASEKKKRIESSKKNTHRNRVGRMALGLSLLSHFSLAFLFIIRRCGRAVCTGTESATLQQRSVTTATRKITEEEKQNKQKKKTD